LPGETAWHPLYVRTLAPIDHRGLHQRRHGTEWEGTNATPYSGQIDPGHGAEGAPSRKHHAIVRAVFLATRHTSTWFPR
jgi:hypothetical protein